MASDKVTPLLREMAIESKNGDLGGFSNTVTRALELRLIHELAEHAVFWQTVNRLIGTVRVEQDEAMLISLAELGRLSASLKAKAKPVAAISSSLLQKRMPAHFSFGDGDQRHYAAIAWERSGHVIAPEVAARTAVLEEASDRGSPHLAPTVDSRVRCLWSTADVEECHRGSPLAVASGIEPIIRLGKG